MPCLNFDVIGEQLLFLNVFSLHYITVLEKSVDCKEQLPCWN